MAQPKLKINELAEIINSLITGRKPDASEIARLKNELRKLTTAKNAEYYDFLGRIVYLENDKEKMIAHYKEAVALSFGNTYAIQENYAFYLNNSGLHFKAKEQLEVITEKFSTRTEILKYVVENRVALCRFREALSLEYRPANFNDVEKYVSIFDKADLSDDEAQYLCELAYSVLETKNLYYSGSEIEIIDNCILYTIYIDLPIEEIFDINWELAGIFVDNGKNRCNEVLAFKYSSVDVLEEKKKYEHRI